MDETLKILKDLIRIPSPSDQPNAEIVKYLTSLLPSFEVRIAPYVKLMPDSNLKLSNLIVRIPGKRSDSPLIFVGHTDTVCAGDGWLENPYEPREENGRIMGLGASDMKGALACMIAAARSLKTTPAQDTYLLFDADEEEGGTGGRKMLEQLSLTNARVIVGEPTDRTLVYAHRGCFDIEIQVLGKERHSGRADYAYNQKHNAIVTMTKICSQLQEYARQIEERTDPLLGKPSLNLGEIHGGKGANTVAGKCSLKVSRRVTSEETLDQAYHEIAGIVKGISPDATLRTLFSGAPFRTNLQERFAQKTLEAIQQELPNVPLRTQEGWTEAALFASYGEALIFGPGSTEKIHQPEEYILTEDIHIFSRIYARLMLQEV